jgi:hypothetical protein
MESRGDQEGRFELTLDQFLRSFNQLDEGVVEPR